MATTSLARQLELLKTPQTSAHRETKGSVSLLYDFFDAKSIDSNTHFSVAVDGLEGLIKLDYSLARFKENLFHESSKCLDRSVMNKEENQKLDELLDEYLFTVVSKYFQITDTMKTLEWLIYRYKIHLYNIDSYVGSVLPYHGTRQFARILQTVSKIKDPGSFRWYWLKQIQMQAVPLSMNILVIHCASNGDFFRYIIDQIFKAVQIDESNIRFASFLVMFCVKILEHSQNEVVISMVVSAISKILRKNKPIFYSPACIIFSHLCSLVKIETSILIKLLKLFAPRYTKPTANKTFLAFNILSKTQELDNFPEEFLSGIIIQELFNWIIKNRNCDSLSFVLFGTLIHFSTDERLNHEMMLENIEKILQNKAIRKKNTVYKIIKTINDSLGQFDNEENNDSKKKSEAFLKSIVLIFEKFYPLALDSAIAELNSSKKISQLLNSFRFSQVEKYNVPLFVGLEHSSKKVRRSSLLYLVKNFKNHISDSEAGYIRDVLKSKFLENFQSISVEILLEIFSVKESIFNLFSPEEFQKIAFKLVHFCEYNLIAKREDAMEIDQDSIENAKWFELKKRLFEIFFSKNFQDYYLEDPHFIAQSIFFTSDFRFRLVNLLFPSNEAQLEILNLLLASPFGKSHPFLKQIKLDDKNKDFERLCLKNFKLLVNFIHEHLDIFLDKETLKKALNSALENDSDSYRRSLMFLILALSQVFKDCQEIDIKEVICSSMLDCIEFIKKNFVLAKISRKTLFNMFNEISEDCFQSCLKQNSLYECSKIPTTTLVFILHQTVSSYVFSLNNNRWSMLREKDNQEMAVYKLFRLLLFFSNNRDLSPSKHTFELFQELFEYFLNKIVFTQSDIFSFFFPTLINENFSEFRLKTLTILNELIQRKELVSRFVTSLENEKKTLIGYLLSLASTQQEYRQAVLNNLELIHTHLDSNRDASIFIKDLFQHKNEILLDYRLLPKIFAKMHHSEEKSHKFVKNIANDLLEAFFNGSLPLECRCLVITLFTNFNDVSRERIFKFYYDNFVNFDELNELQAKELQALLGYLVYANEGIFEKSDSFSVKFYLNALTATETCLPTEACLLVFRAFENSFCTIYEKNFDLAMKIVLKMLEIELRLSKSGLSNHRVNQMKLISWLRRSISSVVINGKFTVELMKNILNIEEAANSFAALNKDGPNNKKKSKLDSAELSGRYVHSWKLLRILVGCIQSKKTFHNSSLLVKCLFDYFRLTFTEACDASIMEHTRQVFLYAISHMIETELEATSNTVKEESKHSSKEIKRSGNVSVITSKKIPKKSLKNSKQLEEHNLFLKQIDIQVIVDCLSESRYQDTQKIALLSLSLLAPHFHLEILDSLVAIFTYIGTSLLQYDDQYSLAILYETIESIVPMILQNSGDKAEERRHYILSIFLDSFNDIPSYRRLVLFTKLIHLLGVEKFLPFFTVLLFEKKYLRFEKTKKEERDGINTLALSLFQAFPIQTQIRSACAILSVFESRFFELIFKKVDLKFDRENLKKLESNIVAKEFKLKLKTEAHQFACGVDLLKFLYELISDQEFRYSLNCIFNKSHESTMDFDDENDGNNNNEKASNEPDAQLQEERKEEEEHNDDHFESLTYFFHLLIEMMVSLGPKEAQTRTSSLQFRRKIRHLLDDILTNFNKLFPATNILDLIIEKMLTNSYSVDEQLFIFIQRRALRLMYEKLSSLNANDISRSKSLELLRNLLNQLPTSIEAIENNREQIYNVQHLMLAFKACFRFLTDSEFKKNNEMELLTVILKKMLTFTESIHCEKKYSDQAEDDKSLSNLKGSCLICLVHVLCSMTADGIEHLGKVISLLLNNFGINDEIVLILNIGAISKIISKFSQFLSPYMSRIILAFLPIFEYSNRDHGVKSKLQSTWNSLAQEIPKRVLFDAISKSYELATKISPNAVIELMLLLKKSCSNIVESEILLKSFRSLMLDAIGYRSEHIGSVDLKLIEQVENAIGEAFSAFFPKLNEGQFRSLFYKLHSSVLKFEQFKEEADKDRIYFSLNKSSCYKMITFYRFCSQLADSLKSLFCLFVVPSIVKNASEMLIAYHSDNNKDDDKEDEDNDDRDDSKLHKLAEGPKLRITDESIGEPLIGAIVETFSKCFLYDLSGSFVNDDNINMIVKPLIHQISNISGTDDEYEKRIEFIQQAVQHLIQNNKDETLIKDVYDLILLKTSDDEKRKIRIAAQKFL